MAKFVSKENLAYYHSKIKTPINFAQEEYNKSLNLINLKDTTSSTVNGITYYVSNGAIHISGTSTANFALEFLLNGNLEMNGEYSYNGFNGNYKPQISFYYDYTWVDDIVARGYSTYGYKTYTNKVFNKIAIPVSNGEIITNGVIKPMLVKGRTIPSEFYQYNGEIVHKGDITPVLLWENASPNSAFVGNNTHNLSKSLSNYTSLKIVYKFNTNNNASYIEEFKTDGIGTGWRYIERRSYSRVFTIPSATSIRFENGYIDSSINDEAIIPLAVYGVK